MVPKTKKLCSTIGRENNAESIGTLPSSLYILPDNLVQDEPVSADTNESAPALTASSQSRGSRKKSSLRHDLSQNVLLCSYYLLLSLSYKAAGVLRSFQLS